MHHECNEGDMPERRSNIGFEMSKGYVKDQSAELFKIGEQPNSTGEGHMQAQTGPKAMQWPMMPKFNSQPTN